MKLSDLPLAVQLAAELQTYEQYDYIVSTSESHLTAGSGVNIVIPKATATKIVEDRIAEIRAKMAAIGLEDDTLTGIQIVAA